MEYHLVCEGIIASNVHTASFWMSGQQESDMSAHIRTQNPSNLFKGLAPLGLVVECAGGVTTHEAYDGSVLDCKIDDLDRRLGVCFGSSEEVAKYKKFMFE